MQDKSNIEQKISSAGKKKGLLGTVLVHVMLFGMLILVGFSTPHQPDTEEGILVNFGTGETGIGDIEPSPPAFKEESSAPPVKEITTPPASAAKVAVKPAVKKAVVAKKPVAKAAVAKKAPAKKPAAKKATK